MSRVRYPNLPSFLRFSIVLPVALLFVLGGCATSAQKREVRIDAINRPAPPGLAALSYEIQTRNPELDERSLRYREAAGHVKTALSGHGLFEAPDNVQPDLVVEIDYGIQPSGFRYEIITVPVYAKMEDANTAVSVPRPGKPARQIDGTILIGYREIACPVPTTEKYLSISARPNRKAPDRSVDPELWRVHASINDEHKDLRACLPVLASAVMENIGQDTEGATNVTLTADDPNVRFISDGM